MKKHKLLVIVLAFDFVAIILIAALLVYLQ